MMDLLEKLAAILDQKNILQNEYMNQHTTFRVGGPADFYVRPETTTELIAVVRLLQQLQVPYYIMGNGSNLLVGDGGYRGVIIQTHERMKEVQVEGNMITAQAGASLARVANVALQHGLTGFEFASGIPGTIGGACIMNAGAYGGEMKDVLIRAQALSDEGIVTVEKAEMELGYRTSVFSRRGYIVLAATIMLQPGETAAIKTEMERLAAQRTAKQPLEYPSAGSTFKRPAGYFAGKLIQDSGLRGKRIGGAMVSEKHSGFVINAHQATARDIVTLMDFIIQTVKEKQGVTLEPEVKRIGVF